MQSSDHYCIDAVPPSGEHCATETVPPSSDHYCIDIVVPSSDHYNTETLPPSSVRHCTQKVVWGLWPPSGYASVRPIPANSPSFERSLSLFNLTEISVFCQIGIDDFLLPQLISVYFFFRGPIMKDDQLPVEHLSPFVSI